MKKIMKINNKKAVSLMISYVLLVTIAIIMSIIVFTYLKTIANVKPVIDCKEGTSIVVEDYSCDANKEEITLTIRNNGIFNVDGFIATFGDDEDREPSAKLKIAEGQEKTLVHYESRNKKIAIDPPRFDIDPIDPKTNPLSPGKIVEVRFTNSEKFESIDNLKVQPYIIDEETELRIACGGKINKQDVEDCQIGTSYSIPNPIAYFKFDGDLKDNTDNEYNLIKNKNLPEFVDRKEYGQAVEFDISDSIKISNNYFYEEMNEEKVSIGFWAKVSEGALFKMNDNKGAGYKGGFILQGKLQDGDDNIQLKWLAGGGSHAICEGNFNNWKHIVVTAKKGGKKIIYVNGIQCDSKDTGGSSIKSNNKKFYIGTQAGFIGTLDEFKIWNVELTPEQVISLFNSYK